MDIKPKEGNSCMKVGERVSVSNERVEGVGDDEMDKEDTPFIKLHALRMNKPTRDRRGKINKKSSPTTPRNHVV